MTKQLLILFTIILGIGHLQVSAQDDKLPDNPEAGKCYVKCVTPDVYKTVEERVMVSPEYTRLEIVPAKYETTTERVLVKEASKRFEYVPATYKTVEVPYVGKEGQTDLTIVPARLADASVDIEIHPMIGRWEYHAQENCISDNPNDCQILCWLEYPAQIRTIPTKDLAVDASTTSSNVPETPASYTKQVIDQPAKVNEFEIPAEYATIEKTMLVEDEKSREITVPAEYITVEKQVLVEKGGVTIWEEVDCKLTDYTILPIYYEYDRARLTADSRQIIDNTLLSLMKTTPNITIEISSHTDARGNDQYNMSLSQRRAQSVVNYLVSKGISKSRLIAKGFGETVLKNRCSNGVQCSEEEHQKNRRTEFRVVSR